MKTHLEFSTHPFAIKSFNLFYLIWYRFPFNLDQNSLAFRPNGNANWSKLESVELSTKFHVEYPLIGGIHSSSILRLHMYVHLYILIPKIYYYNNHTNAYESISTIPWVR